MKVPEVLELDDVFARELPELHRPFTPIAVAEPRLLAFNDELAAELGLDASAMRSEAGVAVLAGNAVPNGSTPVAQGYAGHQFGGWSPRLGDGRAVLLGEVHDLSGTRFDMHLKGSGRTPFSRGGDGRAAVGPMLREYLVAEAMHALGIPTTRALAVVATGESIVRESGHRALEVPGAVLTRIASSHLRVGSFQYAAATGDPALLQRLVDHAIARHVPDAAEAEIPALALYDHVVAVQASLIAQWMQVGFIHGVMNTDNMTISGETIDYGPCAFMDAYDPATVFSSIDHGGRYAYGNQPAIATWNLARLGEAMLALFANESERAVELATTTLQQFPDRFQDAWMAGMRVKLGLASHPTDRPTDEAAETALVADLLALMDEHHIDWTSFLRSLSGRLRDTVPGHDLTPHPALAAWSTRWLPLTTPERADAMDRANPTYIPRNHLVEEALAAATAGDLAPFERLLDVVTHPFDERPGLDRYAQPAPDPSPDYQTFCGT